MIWALKAGLCFPHKHWISKRECVWLLYFLSLCAASVGIHAHIAGDSISHVYWSTKLEKKQFAFVYIILKLFYIHSSSLLSVAERHFSSHGYHSDLCDLTFQTLKVPVRLTFSSISVWQLKFSKVCDATIFCVICTGYKAANNVTVPQRDSRTSQTCQA